MAGFANPFALLGNGTGRQSVPLEVVPHLLSQVIQVFGPEDDRRAGLHPPHVVEAADSAPPVPGRELMLQVVIAAHDPKSIHVSLRVSTRTYAGSPQTTHNVRGT